MAGGIVGTALRDARRNLRPLLLICLALIVGVAGVVSLYSFRLALRQEMSQQSQSLFGADMSIRARTLFTADDEQFLSGIPGQRVRELQLSSMAAFPKQGQSRLVVISAVSQGYPLYGSLDTEPQESGKEFFETNLAIIDRSLAVQFGLIVGDPVKIGDSEFVVGGLLNKSPGSIDLQGVIAPKIFISLSKFSTTNLQRKGSRIRSVEYFKFPATTDVDAVIKSLQSEAARRYLSIESSATRQASIERVVSAVSNYSNLVGLVAMLLGAVGAAGLANLYLLRRRRDLAVLRCLGATTKDLTRFIGLQIAAAGFGGVLLGCLLAAGIQHLLPQVLAEFLPVSLKIPFSPLAYILGAGIGLLTLFAFSIFPILAVAKISPMSVLRIELVPQGISARERLLSVLCVLASVFLAALLLTEGVAPSVLYTVALSAVAGGLFLCAEIGVRMLAKVRRYPGSFAMRQGLANICRPNNQTRLLLVVLGLGTFLFVFIQLCRDMTLARISQFTSENEPNVLAFDIQPDQRPGVEEIASLTGIKIIDSVPMVSMRLTKVKGVAVQELLRSADKEKEFPGWTLTRVYRSTYRPALDTTEELVSGTQIARVQADTHPIPVTIGERIVDSLKLSLGDRLEFEVEGIPVEVVLAGVRKIDWQRIKPNFFVVFPEGVLETAPQTYIVTGRARDVSQSVEFQKRLLAQFSNVSIIDLQLIQSTVDSLLTRLSYAARIIGVLCGGVAVLLLLTIVISSRDQRVREYQILKFLGATRKIVLGVTLAEFGVISGVAVAVGSFFAYAVALALGAYLFQQPVVTVSPEVLLTVLALFCGAVAVSFVATLGTYRRPAVELLR